MGAQLSQLILSNVRNLEEVDLRLGSGFNVFVGQNGSGKTSLLEAVHMLGLGRSFRTRKAPQVIRFDQPQCLVRGEVVTTANQSEPGVWLAVTKSTEGVTQYKFGERLEKSVVELSRALPVQLIDVNSHLLIEGNPENRRKFIDWGVFHMEHAFLQSWRGFCRALVQRNACLKQRQMPSSTWDDPFITHALEVCVARKNYVERFAKVFVPLLSEMINVGNVSIRYKPGWDDELELSQVLEESRGLDMACGFTNNGPHRADLEVLVDNKPAKEVLSRGQIKIFVCIMLLARSKMLASPSDSVFLIDDLHAELDEKNCRSLIKALQEFNSQVFITGIEERLLERSLQGCASRVFHVEHGAIVE